MFGFAVERSQHTCKQIGESLSVTYCVCVFLLFLNYRKTDSNDFKKRNKNTAAYGFECEYLQ